MPRPRHDFVFKYFDLADRFLRVRRLDPRGPDLRVGTGTNRSGYRRALIAACVEEFREDLDERLTALYPDDPLAAEDVLYQLCVSVNPELDIHRVTLRHDATPLAGAEGEPGLAGRLEDVRAALPETAAEGGSGARFAGWRRRAANLESRLRRSVFGQDAAVGAVARAVRKAATGLAEESRPLGCLLLLGRTGTGKTELARVLARELFGAGRGLVRVDCSEFALAHESAKLLGAPPGYVGHEEGGVLTEALRREPESVVLFDEIEKAHPRLHHMLLQVLDDGRLTDNKGRVVSFERALVVLTSNAGARDVVDASRPLGFGEAGGRSPLPGDALAEITGRALERQFTPEFLGRIDETIVFRELDPGDARRIARRQLTELAARVRRGPGRVSFTPAVADWVAREGFSPESGAREIRRVIRRRIEGPLAERLLEGARDAAPWIRVRVQAGEPVFEPELESAD